jgi:hypothetical protein
MKIKYFIKKDSGNVVAIEENGQSYEIARDADHNLPYGISFPDSDTFISIAKGKGKTIFNKIMAAINSGNDIPVFDLHYFSPQPHDSNFCVKCNEYLTHEAHKRWVKEQP